MLLQVLFYVFCGAFMVQFVYYLLVFFKLADYKRDKVMRPEKHAVSVIIAAKNEAKNLKENLPYILGQNYNNYEVVVVNDGSTDETLHILQKFEAKHKNLKIVNVTNGKGKKNAITLGIQNAQNEVLLFTDADCKPKSPEWVNQMQMNFNGYTDLVLGYGPMHKTAGLINKIIRFDTFFIALQYFSLALIGKPYMGVGRNMAYRKSLFTKANGFESHKNVQSGDDDLFVNEVATQQNTVIEIRPTTHVLSNAKATFRSWVTQKRRHMTTSSSYTFGNKIMLGLFSGSQLLFWILFFMLIISNFKFIEVVGLFLSRLFLQMFVYSKTMNKLGEKDLLVFAPFFELILLVLNPFFLLSSIFTEKKWE